MTAVAVVAALFVVFLFYYNVNPESGLMPRCTFKLMTGYDCPGCGFQRALHALLHGRAAEAWGYNPFVFFAVPGALFYIVVESGRRHWPKLHRRATSPAVGNSFSCGLLVDCEECVLIPGVFFQTAEAGAHTAQGMPERICDRKPGNG